MTINPLHRLFIRVYLFAVPSLVRGTGNASVEAGGAEGYYTV